MTDLAASNSRKNGPAAGDASEVGGTRLERLRAYWLSPAGLVIACVTVLALGLRCFIFTQSSFLTSGAVEYDDGVYLGAAIRLLQGALPYKDYAFIQPPGIMVVSLPIALIAKLTSATFGLALARLATACASAACVALAGNLVRHRGAGVTLVTCGLLAVYPADIMSGRTLLLEPWMNLCCLLAATAAFRSGELAVPLRLGLAGIALGFAGSIKFWAAAPAAVLLVIVMLVPRQRWQRVRWYLPCVTAGFLVPLAAVAGTTPLRFLRYTLVYQATRTGASTAMALRLDHLTGLVLVLAQRGLGISPGSYTLFQAESTATMETTVVGVTAPLVVAVVLAALIVVPYARWRRERTHLEWFALGTATLACAAILSYSAFFYHYPAFPAPWLALAAGAAAGAIASRARRGQPGTGTGAADPADAAAVARPGQGRRAARWGVSVAAVTLAVIAGVELAQLSGVHVQGNPSVASLIPAGSCVVSDQVAVTIAADRFTAAAPGCPDVVDALAQTLVLSHGVSPAGGAGNQQAVVSAWESIFSHAQYVWLTAGYVNRIPWTPQLDAWFHAHFHQVAILHHYVDSRVYEKNAAPAG
jgi:alpha-1,2-mannosyltransferase